MADTARRRAPSEARSRNVLAFDGRGLLLVALLAVVPYLLLPPNGFHSDARKVVPANEVVQEGALAEIFTTDFWGLPMDAPYATRSYRPLVSLSYALTVRVFGNSPRPFHLVDMGLHAGVSVLVALLIGLIGGARRWAIPLAVVYAVHPVLSEAVCSFVGRADIMAAAGILGALLLHHKALGHPRRWWLETAAAACLAAALLSKEYAVAAPFMLLVADLARLSRGSTSAELRGQMRTAWIVAFGILGAYLGLRYTLAGALGGVPMIGAGDMPLYDKSLAVRWSTAAWLLIPALRLMLLPWSLNYFYGKGTLPLAEGFGDPKALAGVALVVVAGWLAFRAARHEKTPAPALAAALVFFPLGVTLNTVSLSGVLFAERFLYLPLAGVLLAAGVGLERGVITARARKGVLFLLMIVVTVFAVRTTGRVQQWAKVSRLIEASLASYPDSANANFEMGLVLANPGNPQRDLERAVEHFRHSLAIEDRRPQVWTNYARALGELGRWDEAVAARRKAIDLSPGDVEPLWRWLGEAELKTGHLQRAIQAFRRARELNPDQPENPVLLGNALLRFAQAQLAQGRVDRAVDYAREALDLGVLPGEGYFLGALVLSRAGHEEEARKAAERAVAEDPDLLRRRHRKAVRLDEAGRHAQAASLFQEILVATPDHVSTLFNLGRSLVLAGRPAEAIEPLARGLKIRDDAGARRWLDRARREASFGVVQGKAERWE
ncbi:MAG: tetratricopeptide repeat protein [Acidobacteriota bacterium]|nr:tetratricopeptide repeat protein [Acidobacteriota bacterium]